MQAGSLGAGFRVPESCREWQRKEDSCSSHASKVSMPSQGSKALRLACVAQRQQTCTAALRFKFYLHREGEWRSMTELFRSEDSLKAISPVADADMAEKPTSINLGLLQDTLATSMYVSRDMQNRVC